jgi:AbrB family looped-hinge helix DNA binding protein
LYIYLEALTIIGIQYKLNFSMQHIKYIKSFSKGQVTIPKDIRDALGIGEDFWLKVLVDNGKIIAEPTEQIEDEKESEKKREEYRKKLLTLKTDWFDENDYKKMRKEVKNRLNKYNI